MLASVSRWLAEFVACLLACIDPAMASASDDAPPQVAEVAGTDEFQMDTNAHTII